MKTDQHHPKTTGCVWKCGIHMDLTPKWSAIFNRESDGHPVDLGGTLWLFRIAMEA